MCTGTGMAQARFSLYMKYWASGCCARCNATRKSLHLRHGCVRSWEGETIWIQLQVCVHCTSITRRARKEAKITVRTHPNCLTPTSEKQKMKRQSRENWRIQRKKWSILTRVVSLMLSSSTMISNWPMLPSRTLCSANVCHDNVEMLTRGVLLLCTYPKKVSCFWIIMFSNWIPEATCL